MKETPRVGIGATMCYPQDRYPYIITDVAAKSIKVRRINTDGLQPRTYCNGFPVFDHVFSAEELSARAEGQEQNAYLRKDGTFYLGGIPLQTGQARYFRNYAD